MNHLYEIIENVVHFKSFKLQFKEVRIDFTDLSLKSTFEQLSFDIFIFFLLIRF